MEKAIKESDVIAVICEDCYADCPGTCAEVEKIKALTAVQPEPHWIPVSERMPRDGSWNIFTDGKNISVERYKADAIDHFFPNGRWFQLEDATAWMPLPEAYKPNNK